MFRDGLVVVVLIVAYDVDEEVDDFSVFFDHFFDEGEEHFVEVGQKVIVEGLINGDHIFIELVGGVEIKLNFSIFLIYFHQFMQTVQQMFLLNHRQVA